MGEERDYNLAILVILLLLCWPAALIYYFTRPMKPKYYYPYGPPQPPQYGPPAQQGWGTPVVQCPQCGTTIPNPGAFCPNCGAKLR